VQTAIFDAVTAESAAVFSALTVPVITAAVRIEMTDISRHLVYTPDANRSSIRMAAVIPKTIRSHNVNSLLMTV
jgi:hypothetical protein